MVTKDKFFLTNSKKTGSGAFIREKQRINMYTPFHKKSKMIFANTIKTGLNKI
jgi:hypothetical protein